jgi:hypothetical protein
VHALSVEGLGVMLVVDTCAGNWHARFHIHIPETLFIAEFAKTVCTREQSNTVQTPLAAQRRPCRKPLDRGVVEVARLSRNSGQAVEQPIWSLASRAQARSDAASQKTAVDGDPYAAVLDQLGTLREPGAFKRTNVDTSVQAAFAASSMQCNAAEKGTTVRRRA